MDTKALRQKFLDLAIRGKLVPQDPTDEPASVLLERIRAERQRLVKEGKLKAKDVKNDSIIYKDPSDNLHYEKFSDGTIKCIEDEIPFDIPESWAWERMSNLAMFAGGKTPSTSVKEFWGKDVLWVTSKDMKNEYITTSQDKLSYKGAEQLQVYPKGTILVVVRSGILRHTLPVAVLKEDAAVNQDLKAILFYKKGLEEYFYKCLKGMEKMILQKYTKAGATVENIDFTSFQKILLPIAPENHIAKIVKAVNDITSLVDTIELQREDITPLISATKSKILDLAIRGKLVPQDPNDEPASVLLDRIKAEKEELIKQGKIKRDKAESTIFKGVDNSYYEKVGDDIKCIDCEIPFDIPHSWIWARLKICCNTPIKRGKAPKYISKSNTLVFAQKCNTKSDDINLSLAQFLDESTLIKYSQTDYLQHNDIVINSTGTGTLGRVGLYSENDNRQDFNVVPDSHISVVRITKELNAEIIYFWLKLKQPVLEHEGEGSTNQKELRSEYLSNILIPIPPFNEQRKIVEQIKTIIQKLKNIEESINN